MSCLFLCGVLRKNTQNFSENGVSDSRVSGIDSGGDEKILLP